MCSTLQKLAGKGKEALGTVTGDESKKQVGLNGLAFVHEASEKGQVCQAQPLTFLQLYLNVAHMLPVM